MTSESREEDLLVTECSLLWKKSTASGSGSCVEVSEAGDIILVRDSKNPSGPTLTFSRVEWEALLVGARTGQFQFKFKSR